jgi:hypothetical protein
MNKMKTKYNLLITLLVLAIFNLAIVSSADYGSISYSSSSSNPQFSSPGSSIYTNSYSMSQASTYWPALSNADSCKATSDFIMNIVPGSCTPAVVRSDLLEEQNVPIFCKVDIIKINPLIDISNIKSVSYSGSGKYVSGVSFHPNREAINYNKNFIDNPFISDVGYVVIVLNRIPLEKDMPSSVVVNLTANVQYDLSGFLGAGSNQYYLSPMDESNWSTGDNYKENSFYKGKGYLRTDWIEDGRAQVSIYQDKDTRLTSFVLAKGQTSNVYYMPGFYCRAGVQVRLDDFVAGVKRVKLNVDGDDMWLTEGQKFLNSECQIVSITSTNGGGKLTGNISSWTDFGFNSDYTLQNLLNEGLKTPFNITMNGQNKQVTGVTSGKKGGDKTTSSGQTVTTDSSPVIIIKYKDGNTTTDVPGMTLNMLGISSIQTPVYQKTDSVENKTVKINCKGKTYSLGYGNINNTTPTPTTDSLDQSIYNDKNSKEIPQAIRDNFDRAKENAENIGSFYGSAGEGETIFSAKALYSLGVLARNIGMNESAINLFNKIMNDYANTPYALGAGNELGKVNNQPTIYNNHKIDLIQIELPGKDSASADFSVRQLGSQQLVSNTKQISEKQTFAGDKFRLVKLSSDSVQLVYVNTSNNQNKEVAFTLSNNNSNAFYGNYEISLDNINFQQIAKVSIVSNNPNSASSANFQAEIGIEKRAIQLSPDQLKDRIASLNKTIEQWESIGKRLDTVVSGMKAACFATSTMLMVKNFFSNAGGGANARQDVMQQWYAKCKQNAGTDRVAMDKCINDNSAQIESDVKTLTDIYSKTNNDLIAVENANKAQGSDSVNRKAATSAYLAQNFNQDVSYTETLPDKTGELVKTEKTISRSKLENASLTDLRDLKLNLAIINSGVSDPAKQAASLKIQGISNRLDQASTSGGLYLGTGNNWMNTVKTGYFASGKFKGLASRVPISGTYSNSSGGKISGFYAIMDDAGTGSSGSYTAAGAPTSFWIQNLGSDGVLDSASDNKILINLNTYKPDQEVLGLTAKESSKLVKAAEQAIYVANRNFGKDSYDDNGNKILVDKSAANANEARCQDFMSPSDCNILFNVCDPVMCPSSRCDMGGSYRVDNVAATGIIGSIALCLPNINEGIAIPICLTGVNAGIQNYVSILKSARDCLQDQLTTGRVTGICDEIESIYICEFFWRQIGPFLDMLIPKMVQMAYGQGMKGGGEYLTVQTAWTNLQSSINYFKNDYAVNSMNAFNSRSTTDIGSSFCKAFTSTSVPSGKDFFDNLIQPDSPVQYTAWFDEVPYTGATSPSTSQYKVFYHIYAGKDEGVNFQVYLKHPPASASGGTFGSYQDYVVVATGFAARGSYASETKDFTAPSGYQEVCVRINGQDNCGFKKVTTEFALNYLSDQYYAEQLNNTNIRTKSECVSGSSSASGVLQTLNVQEGIQNSITPNLDQKGVVRICSSSNPGQSTDAARWKDVGYCDDENVRCWLDSKSVQDVITNKNLESSIINGADAYGMINSVDNMSLDEINSIFSVAENLLGDNTGLIKKKIGESGNAVIQNILGSIDNGGAVIGGIGDMKQLLTNLQKVEDHAPSNNLKAKALFYKFRLYYEITDGLNTLWKTGAETSSSFTDGYGEGSVIKDSSGNYYVKKSGMWYRSDSSGNQDYSQDDQEAHLLSELTSPTLVSGSLTDNGGTMVGGSLCDPESVFEGEYSPINEDGALIRDNDSNYWKRIDGTWFRTFDNGISTSSQTASFDSISKPVCYISNVQSGNSEGNSGTQQTIDGEGNYDLIINKTGSNGVEISIQSRSTGNIISGAIPFTVENGQVISQGRTLEDSVKNLAAFDIVITVGDLENEILSMFNQQLTNPSGNSADSSVEQFKSTLDKDLFGNYIIPFTTDSGKKITLSFRDDQWEWSTNRATWFTISDSNNDLNFLSGKNLDDGISAIFVKK